MTSELDAEISTLKGVLANARPLDARALDDLNRHYDVLITYTSNAIEGSTLTHGETATILEKGITIGGKSLRDHLAATDHYEAIQWARQIASADTPIDETVIRELHRRIVMRSDPSIGGQYSQAPRRAVGSQTVYPNPVKIPAMMTELAAVLKASAPTVDTALAAHLGVASIHPFQDGNGRAARLVMNMVLMRAGYPPVSIGPEMRPQYIGALEAHQTGADTSVYPRFMKQQVLATLKDYAAVVAPGEM